MTILSEHFKTAAEAAHVAEQLIHAGSQFTFSRLGGQFTISYPQARQPAQGDDTAKPTIKPQARGPNPPEAA